MVDDERHARDAHQIDGAGDGGSRVRARREPSRDEPASCVQAPAAVDHRQERDDGPAPCCGTSARNVCSCRNVRRTASTARAAHEQEVRRREHVPDTSEIDGGQRGRQVVAREEG